MLMPKNLPPFFPLIILLSLLVLCFFFLLFGKESLAEQSAFIFYLFMSFTLIYSVVKKSISKDPHPKD